MPCYLCGTRQVDPERGSSPWQRGVRADRQVLICPGCQDAGDWAADLNRCRVCASVRLVRRLGEVECRDCGSVEEPAAVTSATGIVVDAGQPMGAPGLSEEVEQAIARVLRRATRSAHALSPAHGDLRGTD